MDEVGGALIAIALVLCAVFVPSAFITGISGQFYRQFALTIAGATVISLIVSLTLSPAMCALLLKPHGRIRNSWWEKPMRGFFRHFNLGFVRRARYGWLATRMVRFAAIMLCSMPASSPLASTNSEGADRLYPAAGSRLSDRRRAIAAGRFARRTDEVMRRDRPCA